MDYRGMRRTEGGGILETMFLFIYNTLTFNNIINHDLWYNQTTVASENKQLCNIMY